MAITKIYKNPTVKQVIFQIQFPNLFFLESKIPEIQLDIISVFPQSALLVKSPIAIAIGNNPFPQQELENDAIAQKVWEFRNANGYELSVSTNSLSISSKLHKTYNNEGGDHRFREIIEFVLDIFGKHIKFPVISRLGLRYIDECPLPEKTTAKYSEYFNSALNLSKNPIENTNEVHLFLVKDVEDCKIIYQEHYMPQESPDVVVLDFDGYKQNVIFSECLAATDKLHCIISDEYERTINEPILKFMEGV